ncbi:MAG: hypothetical protein MMC23_005277 [Stictis urceolatum]|nr:hypothetical protein [Stictis urceolata]
MRRGTRKAVFKLGLFLSALFLIVYLNSPSAGHKAFAWTTIRYQTTTRLPKARGTCPGLAESTKAALVVARVTADGSPRWLDSLMRLYHICVYTADAPLDTSSTSLQVPANRAHEAMAYLTFLVDNYEHVPAAGAVFVHGSRFAWHNDDPIYDNAALLGALNVSAALEPAGYHNLRCDWSASTCPKSVSPQRSLETSFQAVFQPRDARAASDAALPRALEALFGGGESASAKKAARLLLDRTDVIRSQCCAQFVVARERIWQHSLAEYVALRQWLLDGSSDSTSWNRDAAPSDDRVAGRIVSYLWHILFLDHKQTRHSSVGGLDLEQLNKLACPRAEDCYCRLYGRCGLDHCTSPGSCRGQYSLPPGFRLPKDWAAKHS